MMHFGFVVKDMWRSRTNIPAYWATLNVKP